MRKFKLRLLAVFVAAAVCITASPYRICLADENDNSISGLKQQEDKTRDTISNLEKQTKETKDTIALLEEQRRETESNVSELKEESDELKSEIAGYSKKLDDLSGEIEQAEEAMSDVSAQIVTLNGELDTITKEKEERETLLKKRMKSVYERGGSKGMLQLVLEAGSFKDLLNRYVYLESMVGYDRQKIAECQEMAGQIQVKLAEVQALLESGELKVFDTATWTVNGETLTEYLADVDDMGDFQPETNVIADGYFHESEYRSAPYFDIDIDGIINIDA